MAILKYNYIIMTQQDIDQITARGISVDQVNRQLEEIRTGFPFLHIDSAASVGNGITAPTVDERDKYIDLWNEYKREGHKIVKFVPASGAASRMFKDLFAFLNADYDIPTTDFESSPLEKSFVISARKTKARMFVHSYLMEIIRLLWLIYWSRKA